MTGSLPWPDETPWPKLDTGAAHSARVWNYLLGGKDNISQVVSRLPYSGRTPVIQARSH